MSWKWNYERSAGDDPGSREFETQEEAETWLGDEWRELLESGVTAVTLVEDDRIEYGPMSLLPE